MPEMPAHLKVPCPNLSLDTDRAFGTLETEHTELQGLYIDCADLHRSSIDWYAMSRRDYEAAMAKYFKGIRK